MKFNLGKAVSFVTGTCLAAGIAGIISSCASTGPLAKEQSSLPKEQVNASGLFQENCARCHGTDGRAKTFHGRLVGAQNLTSAKWQEKTSDDEIIRAIETGPRAMPAFGKTLSAAEIEALAAHVRTLKAGE